MWVKDPPTKGGGVDGRPQPGDDGGALVGGGAEDAAGVRRGLTVTMTKGRPNEGRSRTKGVAGRRWRYGQRQRDTINLREAQTKGVIKLRETQTKVVIKLTEAQTLST